MVQVAFADGEQADGVHVFERGECEASGELHGPRIFADGQRADAHGGGGVHEQIDGQLARRLNLPLRCGGALTASKVADFQAAAESADSMLSTILGGANFVLHAAGWLEGGLSTGYEKLVLDADRLGAYETVLRGIDTSDDQLGVDAYGDVEPGGHFLGSAHTLRHYSSAFYEAQLSDSNSVEQWEEQGSKDAARRAYERWNRLLADYEAPALDPARREALEDFVARRKADLPDAWY